MHDPLRGTGTSSRDASYRSPKKASSAATSRAKQKKAKKAKNLPAKKERKANLDPKAKKAKKANLERRGASNAAIATFASFESVASGRCLNYTEVGDLSTASCPAKTSGFGAGHLLAGPTPANGATVSNLYVDSNANMSGKDSVLVAVIDNTTGATLLACTVNSTTKTSCSNTGSSGPVAAGDNIEVKLTAIGSSGNNKQWRARFRD